MVALTRSARLEDVSALVRLRMVNAEHHVGLGPSVHRRPKEDAVRGYFESRLRDGPDDLLLLAEVAGEVAGMAEVVLRPAPPEHQILIPRRTAEVHTVVLGRYRGQGVGRALLNAAEQTAGDHGVEFLLAVVFAPNEEAVGFYSSAGFGDHGLLLGKALDTDYAQRP
jgi:GNAT superfamily N-acetyltransferase